MRKILAIFAVMVMALSIAACEGEVEVQEEVQLPPSPEQQAEEQLPVVQEEEEQLPSIEGILNAVVESWENTETYKFDMDMTMEMSGETEEEDFEMSTDMYSTGAVDVVNRKFYTDMSMKMPMPMLGEDQMEMNMEMYLIDDMMYMLMDIPPMGSQWIKSEMPAGQWEQMDYAGSQIELLETAQIELIGTESVDGIDCYVLMLTPDMEQLWQWYLGQSGLSGGENPEVKPEMIKDMFRTFSVKQWITKDTYWIARGDIDMVLEFAPETMGYPDEGGSFTMNVTASYFAYDYNKPVSIVLPPEAEDAMEAPS